MDTLKIDDILCENKNVIKFIGLNRPEKANALNPSLRDDLTSVFRSLTNQVRAVVLYGVGKHFCAGADLEWMQKSGSLTKSENESESRNLSNMFEAIYNSSCPTIACIQGSSMGGGVGLAAACDIVIAEDSAKFCLSEAKLGLIAAIISPYLLNRLSQSALKRLLLTAKLFTAKEACDIGLVDYSFESRDLKLKFLEDVLNNLLQCAPSTKDQLLSLLLLHQSNKSNYLNSCIEVLSKSRSAEDGQHGLLSFLSKKAPPWATRVVLPRNIMDAF